MKCLKILHFSFLLKSREKRIGINRSHFYLYHDINANVHFPSKDNYFVNKDLVSPGNCNSTKNLLDSKTRKNQRQKTIKRTKGMKEIEIGRER